MVVLPSQFDSFEFLRPIAWSEVRAIWKAGEVTQSGWQKHWQKRGYRSWAEWRTVYLAPIRPETLMWFCYRIINPTRDVPFLYGIPSQSWSEQVYRGSLTKQFRELTNEPKVRHSHKIASLRQHFPAHTMLVGLIWQEKLVIIEGQHRCLAISTWDPTIPFRGEVTIALANWTSDLPVLTTRKN